MSKCKREVFTLERIKDVKNFKSFGQNGVLLFTFIEKGEKVVLIHGDVPELTDYNLKILYNSGWSQENLASLYGIGQVTVSKRIRKSPVKVDRVSLINHVIESRIPAHQFITGNLP